MPPWKALSFYSSTFKSYSAAAFTGSVKSGGSKFIKNGKCVKKRRSGTPNAFLNLKEAIFGSE